VAHYWYSSMSPLLKPITAAANGSIHHNGAVVNFSFEISACSAALRLLGRKEGLENAWARIVRYAEAALGQGLSGWGWSLHFPKPLRLSHAHHGAHPLKASDARPQPSPVLNRHRIVGWVVRPGHPAGKVWLHRPDGY